MNAFASRSDSSLNASTSAILLNRFSARVAFRNRITRTQIATSWEIATKVRKIVIMFLASEGLFAAIIICDLVDECNFRVDEFWWRGQNGSSRDSILMR